MCAGLKQHLPTQLVAAASISHWGIRRCCWAGCGPPCFMWIGRLGCPWALPTSSSLCCNRGGGAVSALAGPLSVELLCSLALLGMEPRLFCALSMCGGVRYFTPCYFVVVNNESCVVSWFYIIFILCCFNVYLWKIECNWAYSAISPPSCWFWP
jgi:hypothetical protein